MTKTSTVKKHEPAIIISKFTNEKLCLFKLLKVYMDRTSLLRNSNSNLLISFARHYGNITTGTLSRWIRTVMKLAGLDIDTFKPHSTRSATASHARRKNVSLSTILASVGWRSQSTFAKHYNKPLRGNNGQVSKALEPDT